MKHITKNTLRDLRRNQTECERIFWQLIRNRKIKNKKFIRQFPIKVNHNNHARVFIADFYCSEKKLVIEIDGAYHNNPNQKEYDQLRDLLISKLGYKIIRFSNEYIKENTEKTIQILKSNL